MTDRDKLIELITKAHSEWLRKEYDHETDKNVAEYLADDLLANGVILPPCKVGDKVYIITNVSQEIVESVVIGIWTADGVFSILTIHGTVIADNLGKTVFLTKEEAEAELHKLWKKKGGDQNAR